MPRMSPADAAGVLSNNGSIDMQDPRIKLARLNQSRLDELKHNLGMGVATGAAPSDVEGLESDLASNPYSEQNAAVRQAADAKQTADQQAQVGAAQTFNNPEVAGMRQSQQAAAQKLAAAPATATAAGNLAVEQVKAPSAERVAQIGATGKQNVAVTNAAAKEQVAASQAGKLPTQIQSSAIRSQGFLPKIDQLRQTYDDLDKKGVVGAVSGRWSELVQGKGRFDTGDPATTQELSKFMDDLRFMASGVAAIHGRGGAANLGMINKLEEHLNSGSDHSTFHGTLDSYENLLNMYAHPTAAPMGTPPPPAQGAPAAGGAGGGGSTLPGGVTVTRES
jgi:hypothetical protein